jgi:hypothetical protein
MQKAKQVEAQRYQEKTEDMAAEQKKIYDELLIMQEEYKILVYRLQGLIFAEECDFVYNSHMDVLEKRVDINTMNSEDIEKINKKREKLGVSVLAENGPSESIEYCQKLLRGEVVFEPFDG